MSFKLLYRFATALEDNVFHEQWEIDLSKDEMQAISDEFMAQSEKEKENICHSLECLGTNFNTFELCELDYDSVVKIYKKLDTLSRYYEIRGYSAWELASLSILTLMSKAILLICYRYGCGFIEVSSLKTTDLVIHGDEVYVVCGSTCSLRPLGTLKGEFFKVLSSWRNIRLLEEISDNLFIIFFKYPGLRLGSIDRIDCQIIARYIFLSGHLGADFIYYFKKVNT